MSPVEGIQNSAPILPSDATRERVPVTLPDSAGPLAPRETSVADPISVVAEVLGGATLPPSAPGLADQLLLYVAPRVAHPEALTPSLIIPLLGAAAEHVRQAATESDEISRLGATALSQELRRHRELAERRATLLGAGTPDE